MKELEKSFDVKDLKKTITEQYNKLSDELKKYTEKGTKMASEVVEDHPFKSVGTALACGLILGFLLGRK